jgi:molybdate transport system substrate-binding protein
MKKYIPIFTFLVLLAFVWVFALRTPNAKPQTSETQSPVTILTAASASDVITQIGADFTKETGVKVVVVSGASNALATQILSGAPADLFLSANLEWAKKVADNGYAASSKPLLGNDLVLIVPDKNPGNIASPSDLQKADVHNISLAGENVPCGKYARQALENLKIYDELIGQSKIVRGQDVRAALAFVEQAEAEAGVVYSTDAKMSSKVKVVHAFDPKTYEPIVYPLVLLKEGEKNPSAVKFQSWLMNAQSKNTYLKYGFKLIESPG